MLFFALRRWLLNMCGSATGKVGLFITLLYTAAIIILPITEKWTVWQSTWWFVETATTVGYGDISPAFSPDGTMNLGGLVGIITMALAPVTFVALLTDFVQYMFSRRQKAMKGEKDYSKEQGHIVAMLGGDVADAKKLVDYILADKGRKNRKILIASELMDERPDDRVLFVKGDLTCDDVLHRAAVKTADRVIILCDGDHEAIVTAMAVNHFDDDDPCEMVVHLEHSKNAKVVERIRPDISIVVDNAISRIVKEMQDSGVSKILSNLVSNRHTENALYRLESPNPAEDILLVGSLMEKFDWTNVQSTFCVIDYKDKAHYGPVSLALLAKAIIVVGSERPKLLKVGKKNDYQCV